MTGFEDWLGRESKRSETISERAITHFKASFGPLLADLDVPIGFHWTLVPDLASATDLGRDGHPPTGLFLPALPLPRRMWAGGELEFFAPFKPGDHVSRNSTIADISFKEGATGRLGFVSVDHDWSVDGALRIRERQDIVYREDPKPGSNPTPPLAEDWTIDRTLAITPDPVLLFRYSALTFNGHRIHYDLPYATEVEGYGGLVVHGPMQAMLMMNLAASLLGQAPSRFKYRGLFPLICGTPIRVEASATGGAIRLRVRTEEGIVTMSGQAFA